MKNLSPVIVPPQAKARYLVGIARIEGGPLSGLASLK